VDDAVGIGGSYTEERRLDPKVVLAGAAVMDAHGDLQEDWLVQIEVQCDAAGLPKNGSLFTPLDILMPPIIVLDTGPLSN
jgi:hypothetical protein